VTAAGFAYVSPRDPHPLVLGRCVEHPLEQLPVARLELLTLSQGRASPAYPLRQCIPYPLKLIKPRDSRLHEATGDLGVNVKSRKCLGTQPR